MGRIDPDEGVQDCDRELTPEEQCSNCGEGVPGMQVEYVCHDSHCQECCPDDEDCWN